MANWFVVPLVGQNVAYDGVTLCLATTSGGVPTSATAASGDTVTLDGNSGTGTCTVSVDMACTALTVGGATGTYSGTCLFTHSQAISGTVTLTRGTLNTNGQTCSWGSFSSSNSNARTLTMGASAITITGTGTAWTTATQTSLTITANTATITLSGAGVTWTSSTANWNGATVVFSGSGTATVTATGTFGALTRSGTAVKTDALTLGGSFTVTNACTLGGNSTQGVNRLLVQSNTVGTQRTITASSYTINGDVDFQDTNLAYSGGASWTNAGSAYIGDALGNAGAVTTNATASSTQTATGTASFTWSTHGWTTRVPLPQDDVSIPNAFVAGRTVTLDMPRAGRSLTFSCTGSPTLSHAASTTVYGSFTLASGMTTSGGNAYVFACRTAATITSNGVTHINALTFNAPGCTFTLADNITCSAVSTTPWTWTAGTLSAGTTTIQFTDTTAAKTFAGGGQTYGTIKYVPTGALGFTITGNNTFATLDIECTTAKTLTLPANGTQIITTSIILQGASGQLLSLASSSAGTVTTIKVQPSASVTRAFYSFSADIAFTLQSATTTALTATFTTAGTRTTFGATTTALTATFTTAGVRTRFGATTMPLTATFTTTGRLTAKSSTTLPLTATFTTDGTRTRFGAVSLPLVFTFTTAANSVIGGPPETGSITHRIDGWQGTTGRGHLAALRGAGPDHADDGLLAPVTTGRVE